MRSVSLAAVNQPVGDRARSRRDWGLWVALFVVVSCWILGTPRSGGPDEPSHMVAATALMSGQFEGRVFTTNLGARAFEVPAMVGEPDPACWAMRPAKPVSCAGVPTSDDQIFRLTTSHTYPPWAYVLPGLVAQVASPSNHAYLARLADALVPLVLLGASLSFLRGAGRAGPALLVGLTPIAWFTFGTVNPSGVAIAGGAALLVALIGRRDRVNVALAVAGWAALVLARRDGPIFATLIVLVASAVRGHPPSAWWAMLGRIPRIVVVASVVFAVAWAVVRGDRTAEVVAAAAPLGLIGADVAWRGWTRSAAEGRWAIAGGLVAGAAVVLALISIFRPRGFVPLHVRLIVGATDEHLEALVGVLGWLDTPSPQFVVLLYWALIGGLVLAALVDEPRSALLGAGAIVSLVVVAWVLEFGQGTITGTYWQGRYSLPFAVGLPLIAVWRTGRSLPRRFDLALVSCFVVIVNGGFIAAQQRWAVGVFGSWKPWTWDTWGAPFSPLLLVAIHLAGTCALALVVLRAAEVPAGGREPEPLERVAS